MGRVVAFERPSRAGAAAPAQTAQSKAGYWSARVCWYALSAACSVPTAVLAALRPFIIVLAWCAIFFSVPMVLLGGYLMVPHVRWDHVFQGCVLFFGALLIRHGSDGLLRALRAGKLRCQQHAHKKTGT